MASLSQFIFNIGRARLLLDGEEFEVSYPQRAANFLVNREVEINLYKGDQSIVEVRREDVGVRKFSFRIAGQDFVALPKDGVFEIITEGKLAAQIVEKGLLFPKYEISCLDKRLTSSILIAVLWSMVCPVKILQ